MRRSASGSQVICCSDNLHLSVRSARTRILP
jgi:hypothetical protein